MGQCTVLQLDVATPEPGLTVSTGQESVTKFSQRRRVKSTPLSSDYNRFAVLSVDSTPKIDKPVEQVKDVPNPGMTRQFRPRCERRLPLRLVIASTEDEPRSLKLKVSI